MEHDELTDNIDEAIIDHDVSLLTRGQIDLAWRALCAHMVYASVACFRIKVVNKCCVENRIAARRWLAGGGVITFEEACETVGICGDRILSLLHDQNAFSPPINRARSQTHAQPFGSHQTPGGLVAVSPAFAEDRGRAAGPAAGSRGGRCPVVSVEQD